MTNALRAPPVQMCTSGWVVAYDLWGHLHHSELDLLGNKNILMPAHKKQTDKGTGLLGNQLKARASRIISLKYQFLIQLPLWVPLSALFFLSVALPYENDSYASLNGFENSLPGIEALLLRLLSMYSYHCQNKLLVFF